MYTKQLLLLTLTFAGIAWGAAAPEQFTSRCWDAHWLFNRHSVNPPWVIIRDVQKDYLLQLLRCSINSKESALRNGLLAVTKAIISKNESAYDHYEQGEAEYAVKQNANADALPALLVPSDTATDSLQSLCALEKAVKANPERFPYTHALELLACHANIAAHFGAMDHAQQQLETYFPKHDFTKQPLGDVTTALTEIEKLPQDSLREVRKMYAVFPFARDLGKAALYKLTKGQQAAWKKWAPYCDPFTITVLSAIIEEYLSEHEFADNDLRWIKPPGENECWDPEN